MTSLGVGVASELHRSDFATLGIDVGGTFADVYYEDESLEEPQITKVLTTTVNNSGLGDALQGSRARLGGLRELVYSTTLATNAILERKLGKCALITTTGFRDVIELGRRDRPSTYGLTGSFEPLVPRHLRFEIRERVSAQGEVLESPDMAGVKVLCRELKRLQLDAVVVSFINAYANDLNERKVASELSSLVPDVAVIQASAVHPEWGEFDRTTLGALHGSLMAVIGDHLDDRHAELSNQGFDGSFLVMQSNGGVTPIGQARARPANLLSSGSAAGVIGASWIARGYGDTLITCDMGGTSFDVGMLDHGRPIMTNRSEIDFRIPLVIPTVEVNEIAAGGGGIAKVVAGKLLTVGPESAGSSPGPACYGLGGEFPTVTDAALLLGRFVRGQTLGTGGEIEPDAGLAWGAIRKHIAAPLGLGVADAAEAIVAAATTTMAGGVRSMSIARGLDPRTTTLLAAGGAGPLFACEFAQQAGVRRVVIPRYPGVLNAIGCAVTDLRQDYSQTLNLPLDAEGIRAVQETAKLQRALGAEFVNEVGNGQRVQPVFHIQVDLQYRGQLHTVTVEVADGKPTLQRVQEDFEAGYAKLRGIPIRNVPINVRTVRTVLVIPRNRPNSDHETYPALIEHGRRAKRVGSQDALVDGCGTTVDVFERGLIRPGEKLIGPALIHQADSTVWLPPDTSATAAPDGAIVVAVDSSDRRQSRPRKVR